MDNFWCDIRVISLQTFLDRTGNTACYGITTSGSSGIVHGMGIFFLTHINSLCIEHTDQFLKSDNKIDITSHRTTAGFQFFRSTRTNKYNFGIRMFLFDTSRSRNHRCQLLRNIVDHSRKIFFRKHGPGRAAGSQKKRKFSGCYFFGIMSGF